ncbi:MAG: hypothetical protein MUQ56_01190, partial [Thermoleophilia bacterium]|nr:hypothetical protein [Thermoleophilia bacterium]
AAESAGDDQALRLALSEVEPGLLEDELEDPGQFDFLGPHWMGGEYLPSYLPGETEIARITIQSVTMDVVSIRARRSGGRIFYRVVDEYQAEFDFEPRESNQPLTFAEAVELIECLRRDGGNAEPRCARLKTYARENYDLAVVMVSWERMIQSVADEARSA